MYSSKARGGRRSRRHPTALLALAALIVAGAVSPAARASAVAPGATAGASSRVAPLGDADCPRTAPPTVPALPYRTDFGTPQHLDCAQSQNGATIDFGALAAPPRANPTAPHTVDVVAHWYPGFGVESSLSGGDWNGWYDWRWNATSNRGDGRSAVGYSPEREPLIGDYSGDDPHVLGWIAYWLASGGVKAVSFPATRGFTTDNWEGSNGRRNWRHVYFDQTPNSDALQYVLGIGSAGSAAEIERRAGQLVAFYGKHGGAYEEPDVAGSFPVVSSWDLERMRGVFDDYNGSKRSEAFLVRLADAFKADGHDGVAVLARNAGVLGSTASARLRAKGVHVLFSTYEGKYASSGKGSMSSYLDGLDLSAARRFDNTALGVFTSLDTAYPHGSGYRIAGSTPTLFRRYLDTIGDERRSRGLTRTVSVYNVSEWAEGGPGLIPNMRDGFGYLEALRTWVDAEDRRG